MNGTKPVSMRIVCRVLIVSVLPSLRIGRLLAIVPRTYLVQLTSRGPAELTFAGRTGALSRPCFVAAFARRRVKACSGFTRILANAATNPRVSPVHGGLSTTILFPNPQIGHRCQCL